MAKFCKGSPWEGKLKVSTGTGSTVSNSNSPRLNGYFGNLTFLPEKNLLQNFKLFKKSFPSTRDVDFAYSALRHIFERLSHIFCHPFLFALIQLQIVFLLDLFGKIFMTGLKAILKISAPLICYSKCRCLSFAVYLDITVTDHESWPGI